MFEVKYRWNGWVKKDGVNTNLIKYDYPNLGTSIDLAFSPRLTKSWLRTWFIQSCTFTQN